MANRGEIAVRVVRACRDLDLATVAIYSECDRAGRHVRMADEAVAIGPNPPAESYLRIDRIVDAARATGADAIHPGYGFLSENPLFARACRDAGLTFIGPTSEALELMGNKTAARRAAAAVGVPVVPGTDEPLHEDTDLRTIAALADQIGYPVMVKAAAGGGGKGLRVVERSTDLESAVRLARSEARSAFGDSAIYLERRLTRPRHIEVQLLGDRHGTIVPFVERECSIQRRHQKVVEESPSPVVSADLREKLTAAATAIATSVGYTNAGTIEFLLDESGRFYFLEMNTRLQVEHPVTEAITGIDLVQWQIRIARGERAPAPREAISPRGHAIECRIYAEDADAGFLPSPGRITALRAPDGPGVRDDSAAEAGADVPIFYDPLISKLVAWGEDRSQAIARMRRALREYEILGVRTTLDFFRWLLREPEFTDARFHTEWLDELLQQRRGAPFSVADPSLEEVALVAVGIYAAKRGLSVVVAPEGSAGARSLAEARGRTGSAGEGGGWVQQARREGLRD